MRLSWPGSPVGRPLPAFYCAAICRQNANPPAAPLERGSTAQAAPISHASVRGAPALHLPAPALDDALHQRVDVAKIDNAVAVQVAARARQAHHPGFLVPLWI